MARSLVKQFPSNAAALPVFLVAASKKQLLVSCPFVVASYHTQQDQQKQHAHVVCLSCHERDGSLRGRSLRIGLSPSSVKRQRCHSRQASTEDRESELIVADFFCTKVQRVVMLVDRSHVPFIGAARIAVVRATHG